MFAAVILWALMATAVIGLAIYRKFVAFYHEDDLIHVGPGEEKLISQQVQTTRALDIIDRWGKILTIATAAFGLVLAGIWIYNAWMESLKPVS